MPQPPLHRRPRLVLLVALGGAVGTAVREGLALSFPAAHGTFPWTVFAINLVGSFALGLLLQSLALLGPDEGRRRSLRLFVGTGVLGGFTTYSALATDTASLLGPATWTAVLYGLGTVVLGFAAAVGGIAVGTRILRSSRGSGS